MMHDRSINHAESLWSGRYDLRPLYPELNEGDMLSKDSPSRLPLFSAFAGDTWSSRRRRIQANGEENLSFRPRVLEVPILHPPFSMTDMEPLAPLAGPSGRRDPLSEVGIRARALAQLGMVSGTWVTITVAGGAAKAGARRVCRLVAVDSEAELSDGMQADEVLVPPAMLFNLVGPLCQSLPRVCFARYCFGSRHKPPVAAEATIARVKCPNSSGQEDYSMAIAHFFSSPRVLSEGDIVPVPVPVRPLPTSMGPSDGEPPRPPGTASLPPPSSDDRDRSELALDLVELARSRSSQERKGEDGAGAASDVSARPGSRAGGAVTVSRVSDLIYFKVTRLVSEATAGEEEGEEEGGAVAMVLSRTDSTLMQAGALQASVPDPAACHAFQCRCIDLSLPPASSPPCILRLHAPPPPPPTDPQALQSLLRLLLPVMYQPSATPLLTRTAILVHGPAGIGKGGLIRAAAHRLGCHVREVRTRTLLRPTDVTTMAAFRAALDGARDVGPCVLHLVNVKAAYNVSSRRHGGGEPGLEGRLAAALALCLEELGRGGGGQRQPAQYEAGEQRPANGRAGFRGVIVVGSCDGVEDLAEPIRRCFSHELAIGYPDVDLRLQVLQHCVSSLEAAARGLDLKELARRTSGRTPAELRCVMAKAAQLAFDRAGRGGKPPDGATAEISEEDVSAAEKLLSASLPATVVPPKIPDVRWEDIGGLAHVRQEVMDVIELPLKHPEVFRAGVKRRAGILLYGPPGTGKTLLAKAVATECGLSFLSVKGPELLDMYIGESERNVRAVFAQARAAAPSVLFFDELDSLAPARGRGSDSGGVMDRVVSQLLVELDGVSTPQQGGGGGKGGDVFVMGATNRPDLLDPSLLRPGRFDRLLYLGNAQHGSARLSVLQALTRKFDLHPDVQLAALVDRLPPTFTGADLSAIASQALLAALKRRVQELEEELEIINSSSTSSEEPDASRRLGMAPFLAQLDESELKATVTMQDLLQAATRVTPSVSAEELKHYERLRQQFSSLSQPSRGSGQAPPVPPPPDAGPSPNGDDGPASPTSPPRDRFRNRPDMSNGALHKPQALTTDGDRAVGATEAASSGVGAQAMVSPSRAAADEASGGTAADGTPEGERTGRRAFRRSSSKGARLEQVNTQLYGFQQSPSPSHQPNGNQHRRAPSTRENDGDDASNAPRTPMGSGSLDGRMFI